jgi:hypothetical protein
MRVKPSANRGYGGVVERVGRPQLNVNENGGRGEIGLWIEAARDNNA